jgi:hypothetical protein
MCFHHFSVLGILVGHRPQQAMNGPIGDSAAIPHLAQTVRPVVDVSLM